MAFNRRGFVLDNAGKMLTEEYDVDAKKIGEGTYGSVSIGVNKSTKVSRAIKTVPKSQLKNLVRFRQEISIMKQLDHPNIVKLYETYEDAKNIYLVLELCMGGELFDRIVDRGFFSEAYTASLMKQILSAVFYLHKFNIAHRDLKPENFLFLDKSAESSIKMIDFGLAARFEKGVPMKTKAGTPYYVSPQVLAGKYDEKCDEWSCGVIMYVMLCGYPPFYGETDNDILTRVKAGKFTFPDAEWKLISSDAKELISGLLKFDPATRVTAEKALTHKWFKKLDPRTTPGTSPSHGPSLKPTTSPTVVSLGGDAVSDEGARRSSMLSNLRNFRNQSKFKKLALTVVAQQLQDKEIVALKKTFQDMDENGDGMLSVQEIREGMDKHAVKIPTDLEEIIRAVDSDGSGMIDYTEFIAATVDKKTYIQRDVCWAAFRVFDQDGDGKISLEELTNVLSADTVKSALGEKNLKEMIAEADTNGDGVIDFDEFMAMMKRNTGLDLPTPNA